MTDARRTPVDPADVDATEADALRQALLSCMTDLVGVNPDRASKRDWFFAVASLLRGELSQRSIQQSRAASGRRTKRVYYLSMEYLPGRGLIKTLLDLGLHDRMQDVLRGLGQDLDDIADCEPDPAIGNGGLGRLAACLLDSAAAQGYPAYGYGLRYEFGMFRQVIEDGQQVEQPEGWLRYGNPWEYARSGVCYPVRFYGRLVHDIDASGHRVCRWVDTQDVVAIAHDTAVSGYGTQTVARLRLWAASAARDFDYADFNAGNYLDAVRHKTESENLSKVLYPNDQTQVGQELRLKQEYFFVSASLQDILRRCLRDDGTVDSIPELAAVQLNDTHPALGVAELMRLLVDERGCDWNHAWRIVTRTFSYTNHTLLPEALESWPIAMFERLLPRHLDIVYRINHDFLHQLQMVQPGDIGAMRRMSLIDEDRRRVRMAHLAIVGSHKVNGVAELHTRLLRDQTFADFDRFYPGRFVNVTNGITYRRWLLQANPGLARLVSEKVGRGWPVHPELLKDLEGEAEDTGFRDAFAAVKADNKRRLAAAIAAELGVAVDPASLFDVQIKRIHEYKRQLLNLLHVVTRYNRILDNRTAGMVPRTVILSGKAAPGYDMAKRIIRLANDIAAVINADPRARDWLRLVFLPNYNVSAAERIIPAADLSQQISTAGTEASGTGNMKLALNGALTIGTLDGANIEILRDVGPEAMFIFGLNTDAAQQLRDGGHDPWQHYHDDRELRLALDQIARGAFSPREPDRHRPVSDALLHGGDRYLLTADYAAYVARQDDVDRAYLDAEEWVRKAIVNVASMGHFSSDRMAAEYASKIWNVRPLKL